MSRRNRRKFAPYTVRHGALPVALEQPTPEWTATMTLDRHIARARREMGEARWAELNAEWETGHVG